ncbi:MAG: hypothetical protein KME05_12970 [Gloeocapsa sp. UFS-A4-WI-NPMV-4B04]|jgi:hypothetical protein|nr:hypothetical protein [Gloeocapsa sp. UFS-A4-WI-NPMV-4B04]
MARKGGKRSKGEPAFYDEMKRRVNIALTPTGVNGLENLAEAWGLSKSELVEQIGRGIIPLPSPQQVERLGELSITQPPDSVSNSMGEGGTKGEKQKENKQRSLLS